MSDHVEALFRAAPHLVDSSKPGPGHVMVRCPYHAGGNEKTPSCAVSTRAPIWFCHGCKQSGHLAQMLMHFGLGRAAVDVILPKTAFSKVDDVVTDKIKRGQDPFRGQYVLDEGLLDRYRQAPVSLKTAGFTQRTLKHFEVGYDDDNLRVTYPLRSVFGELVGISGRTIIEGVEPRYKIYDSELKKRTDYAVPSDYTVEEVKSAILWHAHIVRPFFFIKNSGKETLYITEGFKACMWLFQSGVEDAVALVGSYLTTTHAELIARATRKVVLVLDNNEAGHRGTMLAGRRLVKKGVEVRVANYPDEREQPDDLTPQEVQQSVSSPINFLAWSSMHRQPESADWMLKQRRRAAYN